MCKIMQDLRDEGKAEGMVEGRAEGMVEGRAEGRAEGRVEGKMENSMKIALNLLKMGKLSIDEIARSVDLTPEKVCELAGAAGK